MNSHEKYLPVTTPIPLLTVLPPTWCTDFFTYAFAPRQDKHATMSIRTTKTYRLLGFPWACVFLYDRSKSQYYSLRLHTKHWTCNSFSISPIHYPYFPDHHQIIATISLFVTNNRTIYDLKSQTYIHLSIVIFLTDSCVDNNYSISPPSIPSILVPYPSSLLVDFFSILQHHLY